jgi:hypothetical protein
MAAPKTPDKRLQSPSPQQPSEPGSAKSKDRYDNLTTALRLLPLIRRNMRSVNKMKEALKKENKKENPDKRKIKGIEGLMKRTSVRLRDQVEKVWELLEYLVTEENIDQFEVELRSELREMFLMDDSPPVEVPELRMWCI